MDILDGFQKLVSTRRTFSISISIGLDVETTRLINNTFFIYFNLTQRRTGLRFIK
jgi:hypothetical protein